MSLLVFDRVDRFCGSVQALKQVSFSLDEGEVIAVVGPKGSGKTTLLRTAFGLLYPSAGSVHTLGRDPTQHEFFIKSRVGYAPDERWPRPVYKIATYVALHRQLHPNWDEGLARRLLGHLRESSKKVEHLTFDEERWLHLACALAHHPQLLLLDEAPSELNVARQQELLELALGERDDGCAVVFASENRQVAERVARRILTLDHGKVVADEATSA